jgi:hypothetical protein
VSFYIEPLRNITLNLDGVVEVAGLVLNIHDEPSNTSPVTSTRPPAASTAADIAQVVLIGSFSLMGALAVLVILTILGSLCFLRCCKRRYGSDNNYHRL